MSTPQNPVNGDDAPRPMMKIAFDPIFGPFLLGKLLSASGMWINNILCAVITFQLSGSALAVGLVSAAQFVPQALLAPLAGALADRGNRKRQLVVGRLVAATGSASLATWIAITGVEGLPGVGPVFVTALIVGLGFSIGNPAMHSLVPSLVRRRELAPAVTLNSTPFTFGRAAGPALGALVAATFGPQYAFMLAALGNLLFALLLAPLPLGGRPRPAKARTTTSVRSGISYVRRHRSMVLLLAALAAVSAGADPVLTLAPALVSTMGESTYAVGAVVSGFGAGAAAVFPVVGAVQRRIGVAAAGSLGLTLMAAGNLLAAASWSIPVAASCFAIAGAGMSLSLPSFSTLLQTLVADEYRGRVMALWIVSFQGTRPTAALISGGLADMTSVRLSIVAVSVAVAATTWVCRPSRVDPQKPRDNPTTG